MILTFATPDGRLCCYGGATGSAPAKLVAAVPADFERLSGESQVGSLRLRCGTRTMALNFLNQSRSYDATLHAVRFWGHDGAMEVSFYVNEDALKRIQSGLRSDEVGILGAFDVNRNVIHMAAAAKAYRRGRRSSYGLFAADF